MIANLLLQLPEEQPVKTFRDRIDESSNKMLDYIYDTNVVQIKAPRSAFETTGGKKYIELLHDAGNNILS